MMILRVLPIPHRLSGGLQIQTSRISGNRRGAGHSRVVAQARRPALDDDVPPLEKVAGAP
jgi:hypothetical protein